MRPITNYWCGWLTKLFYFQWKKLSFFIICINNKWHIYAVSIDCIFAFVFYRHKNHIFSDTENEIYLFKQTWIWLVPVKFALKCPGRCLIETDFSKHSDICIRLRYRGVMTYFFSSDQVPMWSDSVIDVDLLVICSHKSDIVFRVDMTEARPWFLSKHPSPWTWND